MKHANVVKRAKKNLQNKMSDGKMAGHGQKFAFNDGKINFLSGRARA